MAAASAAKGARRHDPGRRRLGHVAAVVDLERPRESGEHRPVRFFYGARTRADLFYLDEFAALAPKLADFKFIPGALGRRAGDDGPAKQVSFTKSSARTLHAESLTGEIDAYSCGPPPMIDAVMPVLQAAGVEPAASTSTSSPNRSSEMPKAKHELDRIKNKKQTGGTMAMETSTTHKSGAAGVRQVRRIRQPQIQLLRAEGPQSDALRGHDARRAARSRALSAAGLDHPFPERRPDLLQGLDHSAKARNWHAFRAVDQEWEKTHYQRQSTICGMVQSVIENGRRSGAATRFDPTWVKVLQDHLGAYKHAEFGLGTSLMQAQRYGYTQMINNAILTNSSYKLRFAQDLTLYLGEIGLDIPGIDNDAGKQHWLEDPIWQGTRRAIEEIMGATDYLEQYVAINLAFEPLVGELFRSGFIMQMAAAQGDFITPSVVSAAEADYERNLANTVEFIHMLTHDKDHAAHNKHPHGWFDKHVRLALAAANQLQPIWSQPRVKVATFAEALAKAKNRLQAIANETGLKTPATLTPEPGRIQNAIIPIQELSHEQTSRKHLQVDEGHPLRRHDLASVRGHHERQRRSTRHRRGHGEKPGVVVTYMPAMIRIDGQGKLEFRMDEISEALGRPMTPHIFEISTSTHYGRMVMVDEEPSRCSAIWTMR